MNRLKDDLRTHGIVEGEAMLQANSDKKEYLHDATRNTSAAILVGTPINGGTKNEEGKLTKGIVDLANKQLGLIYELKTSSITSESNPVSQYTVPSAETLARGRVQADFYASMANKNVGNDPFWDRPGGWQAGDLAKDEELRKALQNCPEMVCTFHSRAFPDLVVNVYYAGNGVISYYVSPATEAEKKVSVMSPVAGRERTASKVAQDLKSKQSEAEAIYQAAYSSAWWIVVLGTIGRVLAYGGRCRAGCTC